MLSTTLITLTLIISLSNIDPISARTGQIIPLNCTSANGTQATTKCFYGSCNPFNGTCDCFPYYSGDTCLLFAEGYWWNSPIFRFGWLFGGIATLIATLAGCYFHVQAVTPRSIAKY